MAKIDLDSMSIEDLATLRDNATAKLLEKLATRQRELEAEMERLSQFGREVKKSMAAAPLAKPKKTQERKPEEARVVLDVAAPGSEAEAA